MAGDSSKSEQHKALHRQVVEELWNKGNLDVIDKHIHPRMRGRLKAEGFSVDDAKRIVREFREAIPDLHVTIDHQVAEGDQLATFSTLRGTHRGTFRGVAPKGNSIKISTSCITDFADGQVIAETVLFDEQGLLEQLRGN